MHKRYDIALSFAGENRDYVEKVAIILRANKIKVFYDNFEQIDLWGLNLDSHLQKIYRDYSTYIVIFCSEFYLEKKWTTHERQSAQERAVQSDYEYILPARFDSTEIPGLSPTLGYIDLTSTSPLELSKLIIAKLNKSWKPLSIYANLQTNLTEIVLIHEMIKLVTLIEEASHFLQFTIDDHISEQKDAYYFVEDIYFIFSPVYRDVNGYIKHIESNIPKDFWDDSYYTGQDNKAGGTGFSSSYLEFRKLLFHFHECYLNLHIAYWAIGDNRITAYNKIHVHIVKILKLIPKMRKKLESITLAYIK